MSNDNKSMLEGIRSIFWVNKNLIKGWKRRCLWWKKIELIINSIILKRLRRILYNKWI